MREDSRGLPRTEVKAQVLQLLDEGPQTKAELEKDSVAFAGDGASSRNPCQSRWLNDLQARGNVRSESERVKRATGYPVHDPIVGLNLHALTNGVLSEDPIGFSPSEAQHRRAGHEAKAKPLTSAPGPRESPSQPPGRQTEPDQGLRVDFHAPTIGLAHPVANKQFMLSRTVLASKRRWRHVLRLPFTRPTTLKLDDTHRL